MTPDEAWKILESADRLCDEATVHAAIARLAGEITARLKDRYPLVLAVMGGSIFFAGHLLPRLRFPLEFDYIHASRYGNAISGRSEEHTSELQSHHDLVCRLLLEKKK